MGVLQPGETRYIFASNGRTEEALEDVKAFVEDILSTLGEAKDEEVKEAKANKHSALFSDILGKILRFNRPRLVHYIRIVAQKVEPCIESVRDGEDGDLIGGMHLELSCLLFCSNNSSAQEAMANLQRLGPLLRFIGSAGDKGKAKVDIAECRFLCSPMFAGN